MTNTTVLVTGASGKLGRETLDILLANGKPAEQIIATTRAVEKLSDYAEKGVTVRKADFNDPASLPDAFAGAARIAIISTDAIDPGTDRVAQHAAAVEAARKAGARHLVYTSLPDPENSKISFAPDHLGSEKAVIASGLGYTILRNSWYQENLLMALPHAFSQAVWASAAGNGKQSFIGHEDCARAIAAALLANDDHSSILTLNDGESRTVEEIAALASEVTGKPLKVEHISAEALREGLVGAGLPPFVVDLSVSADENIRAGGFDIVNDDFEKLTGRKPRPLRAFFEENKAAF
ncbi:NAD(P)H-binding protein [Martelella radicis]|uniref:NAD(P)H dehydrogenase (Quinone) n=1 Tax=Martelella radicis TaxID=1397476 RepID=A0A7W6KIM7_9HYPH|nr:NAD(P)H-binding protein [Martelella radicis]MBB4120605.1 NAD(P)H dehydrogenase (quinone) [Martelella radicis]